MAVKRTNCYEQALACDLFDKFCNASTLHDVLQYYQNLCKTCALTPTNFNNFFPKLRAKIPSWRANELWTKLEKRSSQACYAKGKYGSDTRVLIVGGGPCGLRTAIEVQLTGAKTVVIEKRNNFTRNNVLHLWPFTITDLRNLGAKIFYGKFCGGSIDHISIRQLQLILLKIALLLGVEIHVNVSFEGLIEPQVEHDLGWKSLVSPIDHPVSHFYFDVIIGADGRRSTLPGFKRKALRAKLAIAITANFINKHTEAEARVQEISGVSYIFKQQFFQELEEAMGIALENIVYYKDETHYFVMTPTKQSLLDKGVLYQDFSDPELLLSPANVDFEALQLFTMQAVVFATNNSLTDLQFSRNSRGEPDVSLFDFTTMYASENSCRAIERKGHKLLMGLVGDSLLEPFWPMGTGFSRGVLASLDMTWSIRSWGKGLKSVCEVLAERESLNRLLAQTTHENLNPNHNQYTIDPSSRYPNLNANAVGARQVKNLFDSDEEVKDIFLSIRESKRCRLVSASSILKWFQEQLFVDGIHVDSILDIFTKGNILISILRRFRPELVSYENDALPAINNQFVFEVLAEEYKIPIMLNGESSVKVQESDFPIVIQYLSQVYNVFKGEIPKPKEILALPENSVGHLCYPNNTNTDLYYNLSVRQFLEAKEQLKKRQAAEEAKSQLERRRSQLIMEVENNYNLPKSTSVVNIPVVKLNPVSPGDLFSACRNGSSRAKCAQPVIPGDTMSKIKLARSKSEIGHKPQSSGSTYTPANQQRQKRSELEMIQLRIRKSQGTTPLGDIFSTFLGKHINQNSGCLSNESNEVVPDENPLSTERNRLIKLPQSRHQNPNAQSYYCCYDEDQVKVEQNKCNPPFLQQEQDPGFKEKCKFLEKSLYNSGRDIKVHIGSAWFQKTADSQKQKKSIPLTLVQSSGFHPLKRGSSFNVRSKMEESFNNTKKEEGDKEFNPKALFLEKRLGEMADRHVLGEWRSNTEKSPSIPRSKNLGSDHSHHFHHHCQSGVQDPNIKPNQNNKEKSQKEKKLNEASSPADDSDLDCWLGSIDMGSIDGQELQELLSSY